MKAGDIIKHTNFLDVCCEVLQYVDRGTYITAYVAWINQGQEISWYMPARKQVLEIQKSQLSEWAKTEPEQRCYRHAKWSSL